MMFLIRIQLIIKRKSGKKRERREEKMTVVGVERISVLKLKNFEIVILTDFNLLKNMGRWGESSQQNYVCCPGGGIFSRVLPDYN